MRTTLILVCLAEIVTAGVGRNASAAGTVKVDAASRGSVHDGRFSIRIHVSNGTAQPAYVYAEYFRARLDDATKQLTLVMHEVPTPPNGSNADCHVHIPQTTVVPASGAIDLEIELPAVQHELVFVPGDPHTKVIDHDLTTATRVNVELGWSNRPLVLPPVPPGVDGPCVFEAERILQGLERGVAVAAFRLS
jgi:hypothetical protein